MRTEVADARTVLHRSSMSEICSDDVAAKLVVIPRRTIQTGKQEWASNH